MTLIGSIVQSLRSFSRARAERSSEDAVHPVTSAHTQPSHEPQFCSLLVIFTLTVNTRDFFIYSVSNLSVHTFWCASSRLSRRVSRCSLCLAGRSWHRFFLGVISCQSQIRTCSEQTRCIRHTFCSIIGRLHLEPEKSCKRTYCHFFD